MVQILRAREIYKKLSSYSVINIIFLLILSTYFSKSFAGEKNNTPQKSDDEYVFDPSLYKGGNFDQSALKNLTKPNSILPGNYNVEVFTNQTFIGSYKISFKTKENKVEPCLTSVLIRDIGFKNMLTKLDKIQNECLFLSDFEPQATSSFSMSDFKLKIQVPESLLDIKPQGWVNPDNYDTGANVGFVNYLANYYHVSYSKQQVTNQDSIWFSLNGGINFDTWQFRQLSTLNWSKQTGVDWNTIRSYVQRPLTSIRSQFSAGQLITNGTFFSGMSYNGINLSSSDAMLPDSMRGYAPTIRGIATSNAKVTISQNGQQIYQKTVPPGSFEIHDLYPTSNSGDLQVQITEADGTIKTFTVPFSAVPDSIRPGISHYNLSLGKTRDMEKDTNFGDLTYQRGLTNSITANSGLRLANNYIASVLGGVYASQMGAIGVDTTFSHTKNPVDNTKLQGWMTHVSWSKTFSSSGTTLSLAGYRYSTSGYRDLSNILGLRDRAFNESNWLTNTTSQRSRFDVTMNQSMGNYGNVFLTAATQDYRNGRTRDTQLQFGYSQSFSHGISMNLSVARQRTGTYTTTNTRGVMETTTSISVSFPLFTGNPRSANLSNTYTHSNSSGDQYQMSASGSLDEQQSTSYSLSAIRDQGYNNTTFSSSLQERLPKVNLGINSSVGRDYWQASGNAQGSVAIHSGGTTFGPYLGDTFGLVEAKGAEGASLFNAPLTRIDSNGYALIPSMTPYRYNNISIDPQGMNGNTEVLDSQKRIAPVAGAIVKVKFRTRTGTAVLIKAVTAEGMAIPMGAQVYNDKNEAVGITGQGGQIYARAEKSTGVFRVSWGDKSEECLLKYSLTENQLRQKLVNLTSKCVN
ncbi:fimbrial biogenesis outer membrane usher protein [Rosenbergiella australiborealis]|uniref:Fimbrial biogenesis outer membrane usher protein n=1 Tax=Rosenbergiella australiborealis TaxID=1544696 RepID=A0ABS5T5K0_9GAMM|nr:fimbria/pilus outer membrane usher protein [Rosenbergiella australiborealis]MBT0727619.1 fimbrial biogenesis outer membrane usher protein [Rosenbergiella australiborealis]